MSLFHTHISHIQINSPIGALTAVANENALLLLQFSDKTDLEQEINAFKKAADSVSEKKSPLLMRLEKELQAYFAGKLKTLETPFQLTGSAFQKKAWQALCNVPYGKTISYSQQACHIGKPKAYRAVGNANGANPLVILVPCHRIVSSNGSLGGYNAGLQRKKWLLELEQNETE